MRIIRQFHILGAALTNDLLQNPYIQKYYRIYTRTRNTFGATTKAINTNDSKKIYTAKHPPK